MLIREKDGYYAGQVREFPSHIALELIAAGRAVNPFHEIEDAPQENSLERPAVINRMTQPGAEAARKRIRR